MAPPVLYGAPVTTFLDALEPDQRARLLERSVRRRFRAGTVIAHEHDEPGSVLIVLTGEVVASTAGPGGREVLLGIAGAGELVGELAAVRGSPRSATLSARTDVEAAAVTGADFRTFLATTPGAALHLLDTVVERLVVADAQRRELATLDVVARVASRLLELAGPEPAGGELRLTHDELAAWTGASREAVTKALAVLRTLGAVRTHRGRIELRDPAVLARRAAV